MLKKLFFVFFVRLLCVSCAIAARPALLEVGLVLNRPGIAVSSSGGFRVRIDGTSRVVYRAAAGEYLKFTVSGNLAALPSGVKAAKFLVEPDRASRLQVHGRQYRGRFTIFRALRGAGINLVNVVDVESYLLGVLKAEMLASFHPEALKAQAVVCRTFALRHRDAFRHLGFGLKATEQSQCYKGMAGEDPRTTAAVLATRGVVLKYNGELIEASYHSCCGGSTERNEDVWQGPPRPYTRSVRCPWCRDCPNFQWKAEVSYDQIEKALVAHGWSLGSIRAVELSYSESGRVRYVVLTTENGRKVHVPGNKFRIIVGRRIIRSLKFVFRDDPVGDLLAMSPDMANESDCRLDGAGADMAVQAIIDGYLNRYRAARRRITIIGRGFGHGVGMCQWGAQGAARRGLSFRAILKHYYRHTKLVKL